MTLIEFEKIIASTGIPVRYKVFKTEQEMPYAVYWLERTDNFIADDKVYQVVNTIAVDLFTAKKDIVTERKLEKAFNDNDIPWEKDGEDFFPELSVFVLTYSVSLVE